MEPSVVPLLGGEVIYKQAAFLGVLINASDTFQTQTDVNLQTATPWKTALHSIEIVIQATVFSHVVTHGHTVGYAAFTGPRLVLQSLFLFYL